MFAHRNVLVVMDREWKSEDVKRLFGDYTTVTSVKTLGALRFHLSRGRYDAVLCGRAFRPGQWRKVLKTAAEASPSVPAIVLANNGNGQEWREAIQAGAFDLVTLPVEAHTLLGIVEQAVESQQARSRYLEPAMLEAISA